VYFEKPRTRLGWKGLIMDPYMNGTNDIAAGLILARQILCTITSMGVPAAIEALDPIIPQYIDDLVSWAAIGARTTESQTHREMASGLSMAVGFKNGTDGSIDTAINAMASSLYPHSFIGIDAEGRTSIVHTSGNDLGHIILRGGKNGPNYHRESIESAGALLVKAALPNRIIIDCSHANSAGDFHRQTMVLQEVVRYHCQGVKGIRGLMLESHLLEGRQDISSDLTQLVYGVSVTDACIGWRDSEQSILQAAETLASFACTTS
jgi:3-deoxy-7-phosphoheptulonate synthase